MHKCDEKNKCRKCSCDFAWLLYAKNWNSSRGCCPGKPGPPGETPYIGDNGNWHVGTVDTGVKAQGPAGPPGPGGGGYTPEEETETGATFRGKTVYRQSRLLENLLIENTTRYTLTIGTPGYFDSIVQCGGEWGDESVLTLPVNVNTGPLRTAGESNHGASALYKPDNGQLVFVYENSSIVDMENGFVYLWFDYTKK